MSAIPFHAGCTCWVAQQPEHVQFDIRRGAHDPECPEYRPSRNATDRMHDIILCERLTRRHEERGSV